MKWTIINLYNELDNKRFNYLKNNLFSDKNYTFHNVINFTNNFFEIDKKLDFNKKERTNYEKYINKFQDIYSKNNINFTCDEYLQKYCSYPQKKLVLNSFSISNNKINVDLSKLCFQYKNILVNSIVKGENLCNICLSKIDNNNLGITKCGHIYCYTCIYESLNYKKECPKCRCKINKEEIYIYNKNFQDNNFHLYDDFSSVLDDLGTKIFNLIKLVLEIKTNIIIFSNFDDNIKKISNILDQLKIQNQILASEKNKIQYPNCVYIANYNLNFYKFSEIDFTMNLIFNEPLYKNQNRIFINMLAVFRNSRIYNLLISNSIEEKVYKQNNYELQKFKKKKTIVI